MSKIEVESIVQRGYKRIVTIKHGKTGERRTITYGDTVSDTHVKLIAPMLWGKATPI